MSVEKGKCTILPFHCQTESESSVLAIVCLQISHHWVFRPPILMCAYLFIHAMFFLFHFGPDLASTVWHGCAISSLVSKSACAS